ncbi:hypothetical protein E2C01_099788 [Portunus trituberculatus]|uniref:Uncharacterized protein n=1 Tax=Portunus trituberculatus TaxID=210409 RepID=A0A5B7KBU0_PORTR|nr:hypothetical protein [Portunus trituberculatus]
MEGKSGETRGEERPREELSFPKTKGRRWRVRERSAGPLGVTDARHCASSDSQYEGLPSLREPAITFSLFL